MAHSQLMDAPTATTRPTTDAPVRGHTSSSTLAAEASPWSAAWLARCEAPAEPPRHRREEPARAQRPHRLSDHRRTPTEG